MSAGATPNLGALASPAGNPAVGAGLALEPIGGGSTSLDQFIRSIEGLTATQGQGILGGGLNQVQAGLGQTQSGVNAAAPVLDFLTKLVKGDQGDVTQAAQPEIDQISQQFDQIRNLISLQPRGGGKTTALAEAPFQKSAAIQRTEGDLRKGAAGQLGALSTSLANIGLGESGIGLNLAGLGAGLENESAQIALQKQGLDYGQSTPIQSFQQFTSGLNSLI